MTIRGRVQGVWFRAETQQVAESIGVSGYVENMPDGSVHVVAEGEEEHLRKLVEFCRRGPRLARVDSIDVSWGEATGELGSSFVIRY